MVCAAPTSRYSLHCRICFPRLHTYLKICRSSICAPLSLAPFFAAQVAPIPRMQAPFSGEFRMLAALRSPLSISRIVPRSAFACPIVKEQRKPKFATMEINANKSTPRQPHPRFYWRFRIFTDFSREANRPKSAFGAVSCSVRNFAVWNNARRTDTAQAERTRTRTDTSGRNRDGRTQHDTSGARQRRTQAERTRREH